MTESGTMSRKDFIKKAMLGAGVASVSLAAGTALANEPKGGGVQDWTIADETASEEEKQDE